ncbi:unnamed protein product [Effrenium voratum]|uniref:CSD2 domain-containing protein n=1 Tax=Effrenium voratum TaxID=2562239 RepID=A0AA36J6E9_9DINO|nr:unnamed protein product [Effrenium voratum]
MKAQPRDRRLPAFWLLHPEEAPPPAPAPDAALAQKKNKREKQRENARIAAQAARQQSLSSAALESTLQESSKGALCVVKFKDWPDESLSPRAELSEILGATGTARAEADALLAFFGLEWRGFSEEMWKKSFVGSSRTRPRWCKASCPGAGTCDTYTA